MAKLVHLKKENGKSFYVTPFAFTQTIKTDKNWRKKYDYVGEVDEEEVGHKSESAQGLGTETKATDEKGKVKTNEREEGTDEIFSSKNGGVSDVEQFEAHMEKVHELMQDDKLEDARTEIKKALAISPNSKAAGRALEHINEQIQSKLNSNNSENGNDKQQSGEKPEEKLESNQNEQSGKKGSSGRKGSGKN